MNSIWRDVRYGLRMLAKSPGFTAVAVLALALGIGGNTAIFSVVYATLLEPLHYQDPDRLVMVWSKPRPEFRNGTSVGDFLDWREKSTVFAGLHAWTDRHVSLATSERPQSVEAGFVTPGWIRNHGLVIRAGRDFLKEEGTPGNDRVVVLTDSLWRGTYGADPGIVGKQVRIDGESRTVVGVLASGPADRVERKLYLPLVFRPEQINHDINWLTVMGRLKPGVTLEQANAEMAVIAGQIAAAYPDERKGWSVSVEPLQNNFLDRDTIRGLWLLLAAVGFVLLIACANVANLQLARGSARQRELVVRSTLGADRRRLVRQLLTESVVLALVGGALGVALARGLLDVIQATMPPFTLPSEADVRLSVPVLLFTIAATSLAGVLFGCAPAWQASRLNLAETLKEGGRSAASGRHRLRRALVMVEFGLALALLAGGGLAIHSLIKLTRVDLGFRTERLLVFNLPAPETRFRDADAMRAFYRRLLERVEAVPGVTAATVSTGIPGWGTTLRRAVRDRGPAGAGGLRPEGRRVQHGLARLLRDVRDPPAARAAALGRGRGARSAGRGRQRDLREALPGRPRPARAAREPGDPRSRAGGARAARRVADRGSHARRPQRRAAQRELPPDRPSVLAEPVARGSGLPAHVGRAGIARPGAGLRSSSRSTPTSRWPTPARWTRSSGGSWPAIVSARCSSAASPRPR